MSYDSAHKSRWEIAEVIFGIPFLLSIVMQYVVPFSIFPETFRQVLIPAGIVLVITGMGIIILARREFAHYDQPTDPGHPTSKIIKTGVFSISRNPLYLGTVIVLSGIAMSLNILWIFVALLLSIKLSIRFLIVPEEQYLSAKFGDEYNEYVTFVRRWLGRK